MLVNGRQRREPEATPDFLEAGRVAVLLDEIVEVIKDFALALRQWQHGARTIRKGKAKVNPGESFTPPSVDGLTRQMWSILFVPVARGPGGRWGFRVIGHADPCLDGPRVA